MKSIGLHWLLLALSVALLGFAVSCGWTTAGLGFDLIGALMLLSGELRSDAAHERYMHQPSHPDASHYVASRRQLPWQQRLPFWVASKLGSADIMDMNRESLEESLPRKFWALAFLTVGFLMQLVGALVEKATSV